MVTGGADRYLMLLHFNHVMSTMVFVAGILCVFSIVWAAFVLMAEGTESRNAGRAKTAVWSAISGLVLVLSIRIVLAALIHATE